jgi:hypothetical protein
LGVVEDLVAPGGRDAWVVFAEGRVDLDVLLEAEDGDSVVLCWLAGC